MVAFFHTFSWFLFWGWVGWHLVTHLLCTSSWWRGIGDTGIYCIPFTIVLCCGLFAEYYVKFCLVCSHQLGSLRVLCVSCCFGGLNNVYVVNDISVWECCGAYLWLDIVKESVIASWCKSLVFLVEVLFPKFQNFSYLS